MGHGKRGSRTALVALGALMVSLVMISSGVVAAEVFTPLTGTPDSPSYGYYDIIVAGRLSIAEDLDDVSTLQVLIYEWIDDGDLLALAIYDDDAGKPGNLVMQTGAIDESSIFEESFPEGDFDVLSGTVTGNQTDLTAGEYHLVYWAEDHMLYPECPWPSQNRCDRQWNPDPVPDEFAMWGHLANGTGYTSYVMFADGLTFPYFPGTFQDDSYFTTEDYSAVTGRLGYTE